MKTKLDIVDFLQREILKVMGGEDDTTTCTVSAMSRAKEEIVRLREALGRIAQLHGFRGGAGPLIAQEALDAK